MALRITYLALGATIGAIVAALAVIAYMNYSVTHPGRVHVPLAWEGITDHNTLAV